MSPIEAGLLFISECKFLYQPFLSGRGEGRVIGSGLLREDEDWRAGVGCGGVGNQPTEGCVPGSVLPRVGPMCCNSCVVWNHQGWEARPQREWL